MGWGLLSNSDLENFTMIPIQLKGHERPLTQIKFNKDGDLFVSVGRDRTANVWFTETGERLGTLGHGGSVMSVDINNDTTYAVTGTADQKVCFWNIKTGGLIRELEFRATQRYVQIHPYGKQAKLLAVQDQHMGQFSTIRVFDIDFSDLSNPKIDESLAIEYREEPFVKAAWTYDGNRIVAVHNNGSVSRINAITGEIEQIQKVHSKNVVDLQMSPDRTYFITASRDSTACMIEVDSDFEKGKQVFRGDVPLNTAAISPIKDIVMAGGGIDAREVTTSSGSKFETHFFHKVFADDWGRVEGHFGPINTIAIHPHGTMYVSGAEDGYMRLHKFDKSYFEFEYPKLAA